MACELADREKLSYAEGMHELVDRYFDRDDVCMAYLTDTDEPGRLKEVRRQFREEQKEREQRWRESHDEWRKNLPPALD